MSEEDYRATLVRIGQIANELEDCTFADVEGWCNTCVDRVGMIKELAAAALRTK